MKTKEFIDKGYFAFNSVHLDKDISYSHTSCMLYNTINSNPDTCCNMYVQPLRIATLKEIELLEKDFIDNIGVIEPACVELLGFNFELTI